VPLPPNRLRAYRADSSPGGASPSLTAVVGGVPRARAPLEDAHAIAKAEEGEAAAASHREPVPRHVEPSLRIPFISASFGAKEP
jgi:hypothetical protein